MRSAMQILVTFVFASLLAGCTATDTLDPIQTSLTYPNKVRLKTLVYIPDEIGDRTLTCSPSTVLCSAWKAEIICGPGYKSALVSGLSAALESVRLVETAPTPEMAKQQQADLLVTVMLSNENANITANEGFWTGSLNTQFQASVSLTFADRDGQNLYSYTANGSGFNNQSGDCGEIAAALTKSMETAMRQVADYIAQGTFGAAMIRDYEKVVLQERENKNVGS